MIDFKKMDNKDFVFVSKSQNTSEDKVFSNFLKERKAKTLHVERKKAKSKVLISTNSR